MSEETKRETLEKKLGELRAKWNEHDKSIDTSTEIMSVLEEQMDEIRAEIEDLP